MTNTLAERWGDVLVPWRIRKDRTNILYCGRQYLHKVRTTLINIGSTCHDSATEVLPKCFMLVTSATSPLRKKIVSTFVPTALVCLMQVCPAEQPNKRNVRWLLRTDCDVSTKNGWKQWKPPQRLLVLYRINCPTSAAMILQCVALA